MNTGFYFQDIFYKKHRAEHNLILIIRLSSFNTGVFMKRRGIFFTILLYVVSVSAGLNSDNYTLANDSDIFGELVVFNVNSNYAISPLYAGATDTDNNKKNIALNSVKNCLWIERSWNFLSLHRNSFK